MIFVLNGVESRNKGAELMMYAILQEIERKHPGSTVYVGAGSVPQGLDYIKTTLTLKSKPIEKLYLLARKYKIDSALRKLRLPRIFEDAYAIKHADYFFDGSGFRFSDQQEGLKLFLYKYENLLKRQKKQGTKIVFLPQAFGPVKKNFTINALKSLNRYADLVMPREPVSFEYLKDCNLLDMEKIRTFTDFTSLVHGEFPDQYQHLRDAVCVIPNRKMILTGVISKEEYIDFLAAVIKQVALKGRKVYLLNHEGLNDEKLAYECQFSLGTDVEVVSGLNALETKGLIGSAYLVITSRYHGVASALNSGVPCLATSWSHKYAALFDDYEMHDCVLDVHDIKQSMLKINEYLDEKNHSEIHEKLINKLPDIQNNTKEMWNTVWNL